MFYDYSQFSSFTPVANGNIVPPPTDASKFTRGLVTGTKVRVMDPDQPGADTWLKSVNYYDDKGRVIQTQSSNINNVASGRDISSNIYYFQGTQGGKRAGLPMTKAGKNKVWSNNKVAKGGTNQCENCEMEVQRAPQSQKGVPTPKNAGQVDHIWPQSKNGDGSVDNGQILCEGCNNAKSDNLPVPKK